MGNEMVLKDGKKVTVISDSHFQELLEEYLGYDAAWWFECRLRGADSDLRDMIDLLKGCQTMKELLNDIDLPDVQDTVEQLRWK